MNPVEAPELAVLDEADAWGFLQYDAPIEDPAMLAFQVAALTVGMQMLKAQLEELKSCMVEHGDYHEGQKK